MPSWSVSKAASTRGPYAPFFVKFAEEFVDWSGGRRLRIQEHASTWREIPEAGPHPPK